MVMSLFIFVCIISSFLRSLFRGLFFCFQQKIKIHCISPFTQTSFFFKPKTGKNKQIVLLNISGRSSVSRFHSPFPVNKKSGEAGDVIYKDFGADMCSYLTFQSGKNLLYNLLNLRVNSSLLSVIIFLFPLSR